MSHRQVSVAGAHLQCWVNGKLLGRVTSFRMNSATPYRSARGIDVVYVQEKIATTVDSSFTLGLVRTLADGGAQGAGLSAAPEEAHLMKYISVLVLDRRTDLPVFKADLCVCTSEDWAADSRGLMSGSLTCEVILWSNESNA